METNGCSIYMHIISLVYLLYGELLEYEYQYKFKSCCGIFLTLVRVTGDDRSSVIYKISFDRSWFWEKYSDAQVKKIQQRRRRVRGVEGARIYIAGESLFISIYRETSAIIRKKDGRSFRPLYPYHPGCPDLWNISVVVVCYSPRT